MGSDHSVPPWLRAFQDDYRVLDLDSRSEDETSRHVRCIEDALAMRPGADVLDIACATGRHAVALATKGHHVTGIDLNEDYLELADERAAAAGTHVDWVPQDMRELERLGPERFDAAVIMYSSFGYFAGYEDNLRVLQGVRQVLRPDGRLLLDIINRDWFLRNYYPSDYVTQDGVFVTRDFQTDGDQTYLHENVFEPLESRLSWSVRNTRDPEPVFTVDYRMYSVHEIAGIIAAAGLRLERTIGGYDGHPFSMLSPRILCVAARP
jgi:SAM-dependent methyltransferase